MIRVVINTEPGNSFYLSDDAVEWLVQHRGWRVSERDDRGFVKDLTAEFAKSPGVWPWCNYTLLAMNPRDLEFRTHPDLIAVIEALGKRANGPFKKLKIIDLPDDVQGWYIEPGCWQRGEMIHEKHRTWP